MSYGDLIAMEVVTYNHPDVVADVLENCAEHYKRCGVEIYYYDSSTNDETRKLIKEYISRGYDNLIHIPLEPGMWPYAKRDMIYAGVGLRRKYKYTWLSKDRAWLEESALVEVLEAASGNYDVILTATRPGDVNYMDSAREFYYRWAPISTSMNVALLNTETILKNFQIPNYPEGYPRYLSDFGHYFFMFEGLARLDKPRIARLEMNKRIHQSELAVSTWENDVFEVWKNSWIKVNDMLPEIYDPYKDYVIKKVVSLPYILAERNRLMDLHNKGILTPETLPQALNNWERISDIPKEVVIAIANGEYDIKYDLTQISDRNDLTRLLVEMAGYVRDGRMAVNQIPLEDLSMAVKMEIVKDEDKPRRNIKLGAAESVVRDIMEGNPEPDKAVLLLQQLLAYII